MKRPLLAKDLQKTCEFIIEYTNKDVTDKAKSKPVPFTITPDSIQNVKEVTNIVSS